MTRALTGHALMLLLASAVAGCGGPAAGPPELIVDRTACADCSMLISTPEVAAAYRIAGRQAAAFDDTACLLAALAGEPTREGLVVWFQDAEGSGWVESAAATVVRTDRSLTPMGSGILAFRDPEAAEAAVHLRGGQLVTLEDLLSEPGREARR